MAPVQVFYGVHLLMSLSLSDVCVFVCDVWSGLNLFSLAVA